MDSISKPSIAGILQSDRASVNATADNYLSYYSASSDQFHGQQQRQLSIDDKESEDKAAIARRRQDAMVVSNAYYDLVTDFYEYGWGESFHFAVMHHGETREHAFAKHEYYLALRLGIQRTDNVLDIGCGIGGPARHIASFTNAKVVGLNCNDYQLSRARILTNKAQLNHLCSFVKGDYHHLPYEDGHFDKVYAVEATCHSPDLSKVYAEVYRVLKPGGLFASYEWIVTDKYDSSNPRHKKLKDDILEGDGLSDVIGASDVLAAARKVGFEVVEARDRALESPVPWYSVLQARWTLSDVKITPVGRWATHVFLTALETVRLSPRGSVKVHRMLCKGADALAAAGVEGIFSPMYVVVLRKPTTS